MVVEACADDGSATEARRSSWRRRLAGALVVGGVAAAAVVGYHGWTHPEVFDGLGGFGMGFDQRTANVPVAVGMSYLREGSERSTVHVIDARALVVENTSRATFSILDCVIDRAAGVGAIGSYGLRGLRKTCHPLTPAVGATMHLSRSYSDQLVLVTTPHRAGVVRVRGLHVTYRHGWQRGAQDLGGSVRITTTSR